MSDKKRASQTLAEDIQRKAGETNNKNIMANVPLTKPAKNLVELLLETD